MPEFCRGTVMAGPVPAIYASPVPVQMADPKSPGQARGLRVGHDCTKRSCGIRKAAWQNAADDDLRTILYSLSRMPRLILPRRGQNELATDAPRMEWFR